MFILIRDEGLACEPNISIDINVDLTDNAKTCSSVLLISSFTKSCVILYENFVVGKLSKV